MKELLKAFVTEIGMNSQYFNDERCVKHWISFVSGLTIQPCSCSFLFYFNLTNLKFDGIRSNSIVRVEELFYTFLFSQAAKCKEPLEIYKAMSSKGIGVRSAQFYKSWASTLEDSGNTQMADKVLEQGIQANAQPAEYLQKYRE